MKSWPRPDCAPRALWSHSYAKTAHLCITRISHQNKGTFGFDKRQSTRHSGTTNRKAHLDASFGHFDVMMKQDHCSCTASENIGSTLSISTVNTYLLNSTHSHVDTLRTDLADVISTWHHTNKIWMSYLREAASLPLGCIPRGGLDPYILLGKVPRLPNTLPLRTIQRQSQWKVPSPELPEDDNWDSTNVFGPLRTLSLIRRTPVEYRLLQSKEDDRSDMLTAILVPL